MFYLRNHAVRNLKNAIAERRLTATEICTDVLSDVLKTNFELGILSDILDRTAVQEAQQVDSLAAKAGPSGALAGVPFVIKDNIDTTPAVCSAGLMRLSDYRPDTDADIVRTLRQEGAVIIGVAATDSGAFGVITPAVTNPFFPARIAGGSSGGPAAAVAAGYCAIAIGTDTGGSIRIPAACCGVAGLKPTFGRVPTGGVRPLSASVDHVGPLARSIADLRCVMELFPSEDSQSGRSIGRDKTIGIPQQFFSDAAPAVRQPVDEVAECCVRLGYNVVSVELPGPDEIVPSHLVLSLSEAAHLHINEPGFDINSLPSVAKEAILLGRSYLGYQYLAAIDVRRRFALCVDDILKSVDMLLLPTLPVLPPMVGARQMVVGDRVMPLLETLIRYTAPFDQSGHPALAMPWPSPIDDAPGSVQFVGPRGRDLALLDLVETIEAARDARFPFRHRQTAR